MKGKDGVEKVIVDERKVDMMIAIIDDLIKKTRERVARERLN